MNGLNYHYPEAYGAGLRVGTCSWKYDSWKGLLYDSHRSYRPDDYLADYSRFLNTVEIDQWFWSLFPAGVRLPDRTTAQTYAASVPDDFRFSVKAPNALTLTHYPVRRGQDGGPKLGPANPNFLSRDLLQKFLEAVAPLGPKLGPIMFQFEYLNRQKMPSAAAFLEKFEGFISRAPRGFSYALETRNPNYLSPGFFSFLKAHNLGYVGLEGYYMPHLAQVFEEHQPELGEVLVLRLHGQSRETIEKDTGKRWDRIVSPQPEVLQAAARIVRSSLKRKVLTYVNVNNHFEGSAPLTIERLFAALEKTGSG